MDLIRELLYQPWIMRATNRSEFLSVRTVGTGIVALLLAAGATNGQEPAKPKAPVEAKDKAGKESSPGQAAIDRKLDAIVLPRVAWEDTTLEEVVEFLRLRSNELDRGEHDPRRRGFNFVVLAPSAEAAKAIASKRITLENRNISFRGAVMETCTQAGLAFRVDDFAVVMYPPDLAGKGKQEAKPARAGEAANFAAERIIPRVDFEDIALAEAVDFLNLRAKELAKGEPVFPIVIDPKADPTAKIHALRIREAPLADVLTYMTELTGQTWEADAKQIRILRK